MSQNGLAMLEFEGTISMDGNSVDIPFILDQVSGGSVSANYVRLPCEPGTPAEYGLPDAFDWSVSYFSPDGPVGFTGFAADMPGQNPSSLSPQRPIGKHAARAAERAETGAVAGHRLSGPPAACYQ